MKMLSFVAAAALLAPPAFAQQAHPHGTSGMNHSQMRGTDRDMMQRMMVGNPYGYAEVDMHQKMIAAKQGDPSEMWTRKMIEHHRGGISMSRVALREAKDAQTRRMAQTTITMQEREVADLQAWLRKHGKRAQ